MPADKERKRRDIIEEEEDDNSDILVSSAVPIYKKPKSRFGFKFFLLSTMLLTGIATGMHFSGYIDVRPYIWSVAPKIPFIGDYLKSHLNIPDVYTLTVADRRKLELQQWQERLDNKEKELQAKTSQSDSLSSELASRKKRIDQQEAELFEKEKIAKTKGKEATAEEEALIKELTDTYQEINPRRAAQIMTQLPDHLAVDLMKKLPQESRASILAKMDPKRAARLTENFANPQ
jgi:flagellar motility protein MotE (MotC chaperone)